MIISGPAAYLEKPKVPVSPYKHLEITAPSGYYATFVVSWRQPLPLQRLVAVTSVYKDENSPPNPIRPQPKIIKETTTHPPRPLGYPSRGRARKEGPI